MIIVAASSYLTKKPLSVTSTPFFLKYGTTDYEPAIFGKGIQKSRGCIIFSDAATIFQKVSCAYRKMMNKIRIYFPVASKELHAVLEMIANVKEKELAKKSAAMKISKGE